MVREFYLSDDSTYKYTVGEGQTLMETYPIYDDVISKGFDNAIVKTYILADLAEEELEGIEQSFGEIANSYFAFNEFRIPESSYPILDQLVDILNKYNNISLEIAAHTDNVGTPDYNMDLSIRRANQLTEYLIEKGISEDRVFAMGYGETRPIASNDTEGGRDMNRRVEFIIFTE
jgi:outer membrane protein OmpA-like peptidoglycan-associated protein